MFKTKLIALAVCLALCIVGFASVSFAAGGGPEHHEHPASAEHHHEAATDSQMMDCSAHHDGHTMKDAQCAVACFALMTAIGWHGVSVQTLAIPEHERIASKPLFYAAYIQNIPTPPPNLA